MSVNTEPVWPVCPRALFVSSCDARTVMTFHAVIALLSATANNCTSSAQSASSCFFLAFARRWRAHFSQYAVLPSPYHSP